MQAMFAEFNELSMIQVKEPGYESLQITKLYYLWHGLVFVEQGCDIIIASWRAWVRG